MSSLTEEVSLYRKPAPPAKLELVRQEVTRMPFWRRILCALNKHRLESTGDSFTRLELRVHDPLWVFDMISNALHSEEDFKQIWKALVVQHKVTIFRCECGQEFVRSRTGKLFVRHFRQPQP